MRLRDSYDLRQIIPASPKRRRGSRYDVDVCPFHEDSNPSFIIYPDWFECKAGCGGGDIVEWVVRTQSISKERAIEILRSGLPDYVEPPKRIEQPKVVEELPQGLGLKYHLEMGPDERRYYRRRGLTDKTIDDFTLGYGVPPSGGLPRFSIPIRDKAGTLLNVRFRRDDRCPECGTEETKEIDKSEHLFRCSYCEHEWNAHPAKYMGCVGSNNARLFNVDCLKDARRVFICEGEFDAMILHQNDYCAVSGTSGAPTFPSAWAALFLRAPFIYVVYDSDEAGRKGAKSVVETIPKARILTLPEKDVTEFFKSHTKEEFEALIAEADRHPNNSLLLRISNGLMRGH